MTDAPSFLFEDTLDRIQTRKCTLLDPPLSQYNACKCLVLRVVEIDIPASLNNIQKFLSTMAKDLDDEVKWLKLQSVDMVYADVPPVPILAAKVIIYCGS
jgi:hypothetical protein